MKGKLHKKDNNWVVTIEELGDLPLHPDLIKEFKDWELMFDNIEARILAQPYADFEVIDGCARLTYKTE
jgi:hypothetical protein